uniref:Uncharacterized protein n=1 Tax=Arundo donax TaxID=35708 RepID=A0A0A9HQF5_ARUDO
MRILFIGCIRSKKNCSYLSVSYSILERYIAISSRNALSHVHFAYATFYNT